MFIKTSTSFISILFSFFISITGAFPVMIDNFTGIWIPPRGSFPFATIFCEKLSGSSKSSVSSKLQCSFINPWQESINTFSVYGDWITNEENHRLVAKYNEDGEIELFDRYSNNDIRMHGKWKRASVRDYIGIWEQKSTNSKAARVHSTIF